MRALAALLVACGAAPALAEGAEPPALPLAEDDDRKALRELSTDRPDKTESPYTVDAGHIQVELDLAAFARDRDGMSRAETFTIAPVNLKLGVTRSTDLQLIFGGHIRQTVTDGSTRRRIPTRGVGDVTVRLKHNLWGNDGGATALALMPFVTLPTGSNGLGAEAAEFGLIVPLAISVGPGVGAGLMTEIDFARDGEERGYRPSFVNSATVAFDLTNRLGLYTELFTERSTARVARWVVTGDVGLTYTVGRNAQIDAGVNLGLTDAADDLAVFIGLSQRF